MEATQVKKALWLGAAGAGLWLGIRYVLPLVFPFAIGLLLALLAKPGTAFLQTRLRLPGALAGAVSVTLVIVLFLVMVVALGAYALKQATALAAYVPDLQQTLSASAGQAKSLVTGAVGNAPEGLRPLLQRVVESSFQSGQSLLDSAAQRLPGVLADLVSRISKGVLTLGTGILAGVMLCPRLPRMRLWLRGRLPLAWKERYLPALRSAKGALIGWGKAQLKLMAVTWGVVSLGLLLAGVAYGPLWAAVIALVDAVPVLGTGTVLIPWGLFLLLQGATPRGLTILVTSLAAMAVRTILEPRLVGRQIGLDPLITLAAFYVGFRLWGIAGMIFLPLFAAVGKTFWESLAVQK